MLFELIDAILGPIADAKCGCKCGNCTHYNKNERKCELDGLNYLDNEEGCDLFILNT